MDVSFQNKQNQHQIKGRRATTSRVGAVGRSWQGRDLRELYERKVFCDSNVGFVCQNSTAKISSFHWSKFYLKKEKNITVKKSINKWEGSEWVDFLNDARMVSREKMLKLGDGTGSSFYFSDDSGCVSPIFLNAILKCKSNRASLRLKFIEWFPAAYKINLNCVLWLCTIWLLSMRVLVPSPHPWLGSHSPELYKKLLHMPTALLMGFSSLHMGASCKLSSLLEAFPMGKVESLACLSPH